MKQLTRARRRVLREHKVTTANRRPGHTVTYRIVWMQDDNGHAFKVKFRRIVRCAHCPAKVVGEGLGMLEIS